MKGKSTEQNRGKDEMTFSHDTELVLLPPGSHQREAAARESDLFYHPSDFDIGESLLFSSNHFLSTITFTIYLTGSASGIID